ncbi:MAG: hypothetical protein IK990_10440 [Ruminiclostridium sp.]|nr:hypothetical protein [Ruminiclostridium sp.]
MKGRNRLRNSIFLALCCVLGLFGKRLISPFSNIITDSLHIPGGIATAFSLMFIVVAAGITGRKGCGTLMGAVQSVLALAFGMTGSMGILAPVGYILPGVVTDLMLTIPERGEKSGAVRIFLANTLSSVTAALTADLIVFRLPLPALALYLCVAASSGAVCGHLAVLLCERLTKVIGPGKEQGYQE